VVLPGAKADAFRRAAIRARFSWSASLAKLGFFAFVQFRHLPLQLVESYEDRHAVLLLSRAPDKQGLPNSGLRSRRRFPPNFARRFVLSQSDEDGVPQ
jgi:hypothetical protein